MKRDAVPRKKSENLQTSVTLSKHPNKKERKKTQKGRRKSQHLNTHLLNIRSQSTQENNSDHTQKMEPETAENSQNLEPSNQIDLYICEILQYLSRLDQEFLLRNQQQQCTFPNQ